MSGRKSRQKGVRGEQFIARELYKAWYGETPIADRDVFVRTDIGRRQLDGDIKVPPDFPFICEVKNRNVTHVFDLSEEFRGWLTDLCSKAIQAGKLGVLFGKSGKQWFAAIVYHQHPPDISERFYQALVENSWVAVMEVNSASQEQGGKQYVGVCLTSLSMFCQVLSFLKESWG